MINYLTAGESHGKALCAIIQGIPAGLKIDFDFVNSELARRQSGYGRGKRMAIESDKAEFIAGVRAGVTTAAPIALLIYNRDYENWSNIVSPTATDTKSRTLTAVRPAHADLSGCIKYGFDDARNVLERASARSTATVVALGAIAKLLLADLGITIGSHTVRIGSTLSNAKVASAVGLNALADSNAVRCLDANASKKMIAEIDNASKNGDTLGGVSEIIVSGVKSGLGSYVSPERKIDAMLASEVMSIQSVKAVEVGEGIEVSKLLGSQAHDAIMPVSNNPLKISRETNRAGGIEGGMTNGEDIIIHAHFKPIPTLMRGLNTVDISTGKSAVAASERSDVCAVGAAGVVCESAVALALVKAVANEFGSDTVTELKSRYRAKEGVK